jgi:hypothetical protein
MSIRLSLIVVPALLLVGFIIFVTVAVAVTLTRPLYTAPPESLVFDHSVHVQVAGLDCAFCHRTADTAASPGLPDVQQCMFCHAVVDKVAPERAKYAQDLAQLRAAWAQQQPINWVKNHRMPDHVKFVHAPHIQAGVACATCHGDVGNTTGSLTQVRALNMGDCVSCHRDRGALTECIACHY